MASRLVTSPMTSRDSVKSEALTDDDDPSVCLSVCLSPTSTINFHSTEGATVVRQRSIAYRLDRSGRCVCLRERP